MLFNDKLILLSDWKTLEQHRTFFDKLAQSKQFNPLDAAKWFSITRSDVTIAVCSFSSKLQNITVNYLSFQKGGRGLLHYYDHSHITALIKLYPELKLKAEQFSVCRGMIYFLHREFILIFETFKRLSIKDNFLMTLPNASNSIHWMLKIGIPFPKMKY